MPGLRHACMAILDGHVAFDSAPAAERKTDVEHEDLVTWCQRTRWLHARLEAVASRGGEFSRFAVTRDAIQWRTRQSRARGYSVVVKSSTNAQVKPSQ